jgi:hypothetical protein
VIGYQIPTVPGGVKLGEFANADLGGEYPGSAVIEFVVSSVDKVSMQVNRPVGTFTSVDITIFNSDEGGVDFTGNLPLTGTTYSADIIGTYAYFIAHEKDVVPIKLEFKA